MPYHRPESMSAPAIWRFAPFAEFSRDNRLMALSWFLYGIAEGLWFYVYPLYIKSLGADPEEIGFVISAGMMGMAASFIPGGLLADRYSRKKIMLAGYLLGLVSMILVAAAPDWRTLLPGFLLYYMSFFIVPAMNSYIANASEGLDLNRVFAMMTAAYSTGIIFSPALGGWLGERVGMRTVFLLSASSMLLATLRTLSLVPGPYIAGYLYTMRPSLPFLASLLLMPFSILMTLALLRRGVEW